MAIATLAKKESSTLDSAPLIVKNKIIAFLSQKGGVGKTTTATHARDWFEQFGSEERRISNNDIKTIFNSKHPPRVKPRTRNFFKWIELQQSLINN